MEARAQAKTIRISSRKVKLVIDLIRGKNVGEALAILKHTPKAASPMVENYYFQRLLTLSINYNMDAEKLYVKEVYVGEGPTLKRIRPRAKGSASQILKRTSHTTIVVAEKE